MALKVFRQFNESWYDDYTQWYVSPEDLTLDFESVNSLERLVPDSGNGHWVQVDPEKISEVRLNYYNFVRSLISNPPRIQEKEWTVNWDGVIVTDNMMVCKSIQNTGKKLSFPPVLVKESPFWGMNLDGSQIEGAA
jgi:hypothetical protein